MPATPLPGEALPRTVHVTLHDVIIHPSKGGDRPWDCCANAAEVRTATAAVAAALSLSNPVTAVATAVLPLAAKAKVPPDPFGYVRVGFNGRFLQPVNLLVIKDTYQPNWNTAAATLTWTHLPFNQSLQLHLSLKDYDPGAELELDDHDTIGDAVIGYADILTAYRAQRVHHVKVAEQSAGNILLVGISVAFGI